jgi:hypothetical protein
VRDDIVLRDKIAPGVHLPEKILSIGVPLLRRLAKPTQCRRIVSRDALAVEVHEPENVLSLGVAAEPLLFVPVRLGIAIEVDKDGVYPDKNRVVKVSPLDTNEAAEAVSSPAPTPKPVPVAAAARSAPSGAAPWHKR